MTIPELYTKPIFALGAEDCVVADVFEALRILPRAQFLRSFLELLKELNPLSALARDFESIAANLDDSEITFWPASNFVPEGFSARRRRPGEELDVLIKLPDCVIGIEAMLGDKLGERPERLPGGWFALSKIAGPLREHFLAIITPDHLPPKVPGIVPDGNYPGCNPKEETTIEQAISTYLRILSQVTPNPQLSAEATDTVASAPGHILWCGWGLLSEKLESSYRAWSQDTAASSQCLVSRQGVDAVAKEMLQLLEQRHLRGFRGFGA